MVAITMAVAPRTPNAFTVGVLAYALTCGMAYAAFSAIVLLAIGRGAASTKYANALFPGQPSHCLHDRVRTDGCTIVSARPGCCIPEALIAIICIVLGLAVLRWINPPRRSDLVLP